MTAQQFVIRVTGKDQPATEHGPYALKRAQKGAADFRQYGFEARLVPVGATTTDEKENLT